MYSVLNIICLIMLCNTAFWLHIRMFHPRFTYFMNDCFLQWPTCQYPWMCTCPYAHMCEIYVKNIYLRVHVCLQMGVHIFEIFDYVCACMYVCVDVFVLIH